MPNETRRARTSPPRSRAALTRVRRACLAFPEATEKEAWGAPTFRVRDRLFVMFVDDHHGEANAENAMRRSRRCTNGDGRLAIWCNAPPGAQEALVTSDPRHFFVPPYVGAKGWIGVRLDGGLKPTVIAGRIREAYHATSAPRPGRKSPARRTAR